MLRELVKHSKYWTAEKITSEYYKNLLDPICCTDAVSGVPYVTASVSNGIFLTQSSSCTFFETNTGRIFRLDRVVRPHDWRAQVALYKISRGKFNMDAPISSASITLGDQLYRYSVYQRSGKNAGVDVILDIGAGIVTPEYIKEFVDQSIIVLESIKEVVNQENVLWSSKAIMFGQRIRIDNDYSWKTFIRWKYTADEVYHRSIENFEYVLNTVFTMQNQMFNTNYSSIDVNQGVAYAREKWKTAIF